MSQAGQSFILSVIRGADVTDESAEYLRNLRKKRIPSRFKREVRRKNASTKRV